MKGKEICLQDMLRCRERRAGHQDTLLARYGLPVLSFCMNIPGPVKTTLDIRRAFEEGKTEILAVLEQKRISIYEKTEIHEATGDEMLLAFDAPASQVKRWMTEIEEGHPFGRLFDIDILDENGRKLSRPTFRTCLICGRQAQECAGARRHTVEEMQKKIEEMLRR